MFVPTRSGGMEDSVKVPFTLSASGGIDAPPRFSAQKARGNGDARKSSYHSLLRDKRNLD